MSRAITIAQRELSSMFRVPAGWIIIALFAFLTAVLFVNQTIIPGQPGTLRYFFSYSGWLLIPIAPAISMRLMSEEYRSGSFEALRTAPAGDWSVTIGKYLGSLAFLILMLVPTLVYPIVLTLVSNPAPDIGPIIAGYLMLTLVGMLYLGIGMVASSLTASQTLAFLGTVMTLIFILVLTSVIAKQTSVQTAIILSMLSITDRVNELSKGIIDTATIAFFLIGSAWMLTLASGVLEVRRLGKSRPITIVTVAVFILATGTAAIFAGFITNTYHYRVDVTSTGSHKLSARALGIVDRLNAPTEIVLAIGMNRADTRSVDLVSDVLDAYERSNPLLSVRIIDLDSPDGIDHTKQLLADLADRESDIIEANMATLDASADLLLELAPKLANITASLQRLGNSIAPTTQTNANNRGAFEQRAQLFRLHARDVQKQGEQIKSQIDSHQPTAAIFPFDTYADPIEQLLARLMNQLDELSVQIDLFANADELDIDPRTIAKSMVRSLEQLRDQAAVAHSRITRLESVDALRVGRALETGEALLVIGSPDQGIAAIDLDALLPSAVALERAGISAAGVIGPRAQELIASALAQLVAPVQPILIFVHGGKPNELLGASKLFTKTVDKLKAKGIDTLEWAAVENPTPPDLDELDPLGNRPIVFAVISVDSSAGTDSSGLTGAKRATEIGQIVAELIEQGESVIISLSPSIFPAANIIDPMAAALAPLGIIPDAGRVLMHERIATLGRVADPITRVVPERANNSANPTHPIADALAGLSTVLPWAIPMSIEQIPGVQALPIIQTLPTDQANTTWAERDWTNFWHTEPKLRNIMRNQPIFDINTDAHAERWTLAASAERTHRGDIQRVIVVGSNGWSTDAITADSEQLVDGRVVIRWAGNLTLFDSSINWLAGMEDLIGPGTQARPIATIQSLDHKQRSMIRWLLLAGLPGLILILGMASRLIFG